MHIREFTPFSRLAASFALLAVAGGGAIVHADTPVEVAPGVTPYRPSVSTPAALSAPGWFELEAGAQHMRGGGNANDRRDSVPYTFKLAFTPDWGIRLGGEAWVRQHDDTGQHVSGGGDSSIVLKRRFAIGDDSPFAFGDASAIGLEAGTTIPTAHAGIGSGKSDVSLNAIYSVDLGAYHSDLNLVSTRTGAVEAGVGRRQTLWAASLSRTLDSHWGLAGECSGTQQRGAEPTRQALLAASYNVSKSLALDAGLARSMRPGTHDRSFFTGMTVLAGRWF